MSNNEYTSLETFIYEYSNGKAFSWEDPKGIERYMGLEFSYLNHYHRLCREPIDSIPKGEKGRFHVMEMFFKNDDYPFYDHYLDIGWYESLDSVLKNCIIQEKPFETIILSEKTQILSKD